MGRENGKSTWEKECQIPNVECREPTAWTENLKSPCRGCQLGHCWAVAVVSIQNTWNQWVDKKTSDHTHLSPGGGSSAMLMAKERAAIGSSTSPWPKLTTPSSKRLCRMLRIAHNHLNREPSTWWWIKVIVSSKFPRRSLQAKYTQFLFSNFNPYWYPSLRKL